MEADPEQPLAGRTIAITADRRWSEQANLFTKRGATVLHGPTLRTVDLSADAALQQATEAVIAAPPDYLVATTGMGMRMWLEAADSRGRGLPLRAALAQSRVVARGAKSASAVKGAGFEVWWQAPTERMDDIIEHLRGVGVGNARIALQLFDPGGHPSTSALGALAAELLEVPVYRWLLPEHPEPAHALIDAVVNGRVAAVTFTAQPAVYHLFRLAGTVGVKHALRRALNGEVVCACVGPVCAEATRDEGITTAVWPDPPRLAAMVRLVCQRLGPSLAPSAE
jgi:uroporphyrinogen-III synthase